MKNIRMALILLFPVLGFSALSEPASARLEARLVDHATGRPLAARVAITNAEGKFVEIDGSHPHLQYLNKRWCYVDGSFSLTLPDSPIHLEIRRGFETRPWIASFTNSGPGALIRTNFALRRWIDLRQQGYMSGDIHAHLPVPVEALLQMQAEDLQALSLLIMPDPQLPVAVNDHFTGRLDANSTPDCQIYVSQEIRDWHLGHLTLLGLKSIIPGYPNAGGALHVWEKHPHWDLIKPLRAAREQNASIFWSHLCSLPGAELPVALALGLVDGVELITWNDPTQFPNHWSPWRQSGMSQAEFPIMRALDLYYTILNAGFRLPIAAGTDKFVEDIPLGGNRVYARVKPPGHYAAWLEAVKAGKGFVSNGPILEFEAGDHQPGELVEFKGTKRVKTRVTARSILPFTTLEIVKNGEIVGHKTVAVWDNPPVDGVYSMRVEADVELAQSGWLAARVADHPDLKNRILPRDLSVFAHTNPIYFWKDGRKVREEASIIYLRKYVQGVLHWLGTNPDFTNPQDQDTARRAAEEALTYFHRL